MSRDRHSDQPISAEELLLVEALYGETPESEASSADLESYRDLRAMFADLPDEDPPSAISAKLMSAAAEAVKARTPEKAGWWSRFVALFGPIGSHPALAAAASLVLVVTIGSVMMMTNRAKVAEPDVGDEGASVELTRSDNSPEEAKPTTAGQGESAGSSPPKEAAAEPTVIETPKAPKTKAPPPPPPSRDGRNASKNTRGPGAKDRLQDKKRDDSLKGSGGKTGLDFNVNEGDEEELADATPEPTDETGKSSQQSNAPALPTEKPSKIAAEIESLTSQTRRAAAKGDCAEVRAKTARLRKIDVSVYNQLTRESKIRACTPPVKKPKKSK